MRSSGYGSWVSLFDRLFSGGAGHAEALKALLKGHDMGPAVLEVGCGSGRLAETLSNKGCRVTAVDSDLDMISFCREHYSRKKDLVFLPGRMDGLDQFKPDQIYEGVFCIGNTLAHCHNRGELYAFLCQARKRLAFQGVLVLGIVNMPPLLKKRVTLLPRLEWHGWRLERSCRFIPGNAFIDFHIRLVDPMGRIFRHQRQAWLVLDPLELKALVEELGFVVGDVLNQPGGRPFLPEDGGCFLVAEKR